MSKTQLVACLDKQEFGIENGLTFDGITDWSTTMVLLPRGNVGVPAKHVDILNEYVKVDKKNYFET